MSTWKATMPKGATTQGKQHFVFATLAAPKGARMELTGQLTPDQRERILKILSERAS